MGEKRWFCRVFYYTGGRGDPNNTLVEQKVVDWLIKNQLEPENFKVLAAHTNEDQIVIMRIVYFAEKEMVD
ncbi:MAG: hypothetical protein G01um10143_310 [Parcubacteria group bacterium Gr01-1014_3]|nr:MAG: hypothetical protein G01um10143_310 [Parcubacteria group bacterium Gr01-1014_3]